MRIFTLALAYQLPRLVQSAALISLLHGCALQPTLSPESAAAWQQRQTTLSALHTWEAQGRIGVVTGAEGWHASLQWTQQPTTYRIQLLGPLGQGRVTINGTAQQTEVQTQDGQKWVAADADESVAQILGIRLPVNGLRYWILGLPAAQPPPTHVQIDSSGRLLRLEQDGWVIEYAAYVPTTRLNLELPERISARRADLNVKLVLTQWML